MSYRILFKTFRCQIWLPNTKPLFWESKVKVKTLHKLSPYIWLPYKFFLKSVKKPELNLRINGILVQGFKMAKTIFLGKRGKNWNFLKTCSFDLSFLLNCVEVYHKLESNLMSYGILVQSLKMPNLFDEYKTILLGKQGKHWNFLKAFSLYLNFLWSLSIA